jgi:hypothetical protein
MTDREIKIVFQPGCFDNFDGSQEELDSLVKQIQDMIGDGSLFENSREMTEEDFDDLPDDLRESILRDLEMIEDLDSVEQNRKRQLN